MRNDWVTIEELLTSGWSRSLLLRMSPFIGSASHEVADDDTSPLGYPRHLIVANRNHEIVKRRQENIDKGQRDYDIAVRKREQAAATKEERQAIEEAARDAVSQKFFCEWSEITAEELSKYDPTNQIEEELVDNRIEVLKKDSEIRRRKLAMGERRKIARALKMRVGDLDEAKLITYSEENDVEYLSWMIVNTGEYLTIDSCLKNWTYPRRDAEPRMDNEIKYWRRCQTEQVFSKSGAAKLGLDTTLADPVARHEFHKYQVGFITCDVYRESDCVRIRPIEVLPE